MDELIESGKADTLIRQELGAEGRLDDDVRVFLNHPFVERSR